MISSRMVIHKNTAEMVALRLPYEEMVSFRLIFLKLFKNTS